MKLVNDYIRSRGSKSHTLLLITVESELETLLINLGICYNTNEERLKFGESLDQVINSAIQFRSEIRYKALCQLQAGNIESAQETLRLCDKFRQMLGTEGISLQVQRIRRKFYCMLG